MKTTNYLLIMVFCIGLMPLVSALDDNEIRSGNSSEFEQLPYNISGEMGGNTTILGLSKDFALKLGVLLILTTVVLSIRPFVLGYGMFFVMLLVFTESMGILSLPSGVLVLILFLIGIEMLSKKHYDRA